MKSGHGRVVLLYFEWYERIWGGYPATEQIQGGLESVDLMRHSLVKQPNWGTLTLVPPPSTTEAVDGNMNIPDQASGGESSTQSHVQQRREFLDEKLSNYKQEKSKQRLTVDSQLAKEDIDIKRRLLDQIDGMDKQYSDNMAKLSANMGRLTDSIFDGFILFRGLLLQKNSQCTTHHNRPCTTPPQLMYHPLQQVMQPPQQQPILNRHQQPLFSASSDDTSGPASPQSPDDQYTF